MFEELRKRYPHEIRADAVGSFKPIEIHSIENSKKSVVEAGLLDNVKGALSDMEGVLPYFAEAYNISPKLPDYVLVPTVIMPSDLPNRNLIAFPREELLRANVETGQLGFQSWAKKHTCIDHVNKRIPEDSKGIIFASFLKPIVNTQLMKVVCLLGYDRRRDPRLANSILSGERTNYSMGAICSHYTCSICASVFPDNPCEHVELPSRNMRRPLQLRADNNGRLMYLKARDFVGFEVSSVTAPAYLSASTDKNRVINMMAN